MHMKTNFKVKCLAIICLLMGGVTLQAQQVTECEIDSSYIYPENGKLIKIDYDDMYFLCKVDNKYGVVDDRKHVLIPIEYDDARWFTNYKDRILLQKGKDCGLIYTNGTWMIPPVVASIKYVDAFNYEITKHDGSKFTINTDQTSHEFNLQWAQTYLSAGWKPTFYLRNDSATKVIPLDDFWTSGRFHEGMMPVWDRNAKKLGYLNKEGEWKIPLIIPVDSRPSFDDDCFAFRGGYLIIKQKDAVYSASSYTYKVYDKSGKLCWSQKSYDNSGSHDLSDYVDGGFALEKISTSGANGYFRFRYVSPTGAEMCPGVLVNRIPSYFRCGGVENYIRPMSEDMVAYPDMTTQDFKWGFFDKNGKIVIRAKYAKVHDFHEGLAAVQMPEGGDTPNKWGFIDKTGSMVIPAKFSKEPSDFSEGLAVVEKTNGMKVYVDKNGQVVSPEYTDALPFVHGAAFIQGEMREYSYDCFAIDHSFNTVSQNLDETIFGTFNRKQVENDVKHPERSMRGLYFDTSGHKMLYTSWGDVFYVYAFGDYDIKSLTEGMVHIECGPYDDRRTFYCDYSGKIKFVLVRNEF